MSSVIVRARPALSKRYGSICSSCLGRFSQPAANARRPEFARLQRSFADRKSVIQPEGRKEAARRLDPPPPEEIPQKAYAPDPKTKDGFLAPSIYAAQPKHPPLLLDRLPDIVPDYLPETRRNLDSTRPAALQSVEQEPNEPVFKYYFRLGKSYLTFYKTGSKNILTNYREMREIRAWLRPFTIGGAARYGGTSQEIRKEWHAVPHLSRREWVLYHRTKHDLFKLIPFGLVLLICGEFTPLVVLFLGNRVTPYTCRIPSQQRATIDNHLTRFRTYHREMRRLTKSSVPNPKHTFDFQVHSHPLEHPWRRDALFGYLAGQTNFTSFPFPLTAGLYWHAILGPRLRGYWDSIFCETILIQRQGGFSSLSPQDIYDYAVNYGSISLFVIMQHEIGHRKNYDFINESLKDRLVPILDEEAKIMFTDDFTRLPPDMHWARAYRDSRRWGKHTPDIQGALGLMKEFGMSWGTGPEEWGGNWKFDKPAIDSPTAEGKQEGTAAIPESSVAMAPDSGLPTTPSPSPPSPPSPQEPVAHQEPVAQQARFHNTPKTPVPVSTQNTSKQQTQSKQTEHVQEAQKA